VKEEGTKIMAEFCLDCYNELNGTNDKSSKFIISKELDLCEGCGEYKQIVVAYKKDYILYRLRIVIIVSKILTIPFYLFWRFAIYPIQRRIKQKLR